MTLDEAIDYHERLCISETEAAEMLSMPETIKPHKEAAERHRRYAGWLRELQLLSMVTEWYTVIVGGNKAVACSNCDAVFDPEDVAEWRFCPECGAKLKGEAEDE